MTNKTANGLDRRTFLATSLVAGAFAAMSEPLAAQTSGKKTFTILHTNDLQSNLIGMAPAADYTPLTLNDDNTWGGFARLATKIRERKAATEGLGPLLVLDAGDFSMGTAFAAATRETGAELRLLAIWVLMQRHSGTMTSILDQRVPLPPSALSSMQGKCRLY